MSSELLFNEMNLRSGIHEHEGDKAGTIMRHYSLAQGIKRQQAWRENIRSTEIQQDNNLMDETVNADI